MLSITNLEFRFPEKSELTGSEIVYCLFERDKVLVQTLPDENINPFLSKDQVESFGLALPELAVGVLKSKKILMTGSITQQTLPESDYELIPLISLFFSQSAEQAQLVGRAGQLLHWNDRNRYCGHCGNSTTRVANEYSRLCEPCNSSIYPKISPCIITLVTRGEEFLLAKNAQTKGEWYSTLAGFVEPGESLEETLHREVFEEVGLKVTKLRYFGSQPWPFPGQLMVGFYAEYESGDIQVDGEEIIEARWFNKESLPSFPGEFSIAGQLINNFIKDL